MALVADSIGRPMANRATNHQYPGLRAARAVTARPPLTQPSSIRRRPWRSARAASGRLAREARRTIARPIPSVVPDRPTLATVEVPSLVSPKAWATSPRAVVAPNWANPAAMVAAATARMAGCRQPCRRTRRAEEASAPGSPGGDGPVAPVEVKSLMAWRSGCRQRTLAPGTGAAGRARGPPPGRPEGRVVTTRPLQEILTLFARYGSVTGSPGSASPPVPVPVPGRCPWSLAAAPVVSPLLLWSSAILFAADGMRPDLVDRFAAAGDMPNLRELKRRGVQGRNGLTQSFPPNTGVGWYSLATGAWPGKHGSTNNAFHQTGTDFSRGTSFTAPGVLQADSIASAAEWAGRQVAQLDWVAGRQANIAGPTVDFTTFFSARGVLTTPAVPEEQAGAARFGLSYQLASFEAASGWTNVPEGDPATPPQQTTLTVTTTSSALNPDRVYDVYVFDSRADNRRAYDRVLLVPEAAGKDASQAAATLREGHFEEVKLRGADGLIGARAGQSAGFYVKLTDLSADLSRFKIYFTSVARANATCRTDACAALSAGGTGEDQLEKYIADNLPSWIAADFAPLEAHIIDEDTYVEQARDLEGRYGDAVVRFVLGELQPETDLAMVGYPATDELSHQFLGLITPTDLDGRPNPFFDIVDGQGRATTGSGSGPATSAAPTTSRRQARADQAVHAERRGRHGQLRPRLRGRLGGGQRRQGPDRHRPAAKQAAGQLPARRRRHDHQGQG